MSPYFTRLCSTAPGTGAETWQVLCSVEHGIGGPPHLWGTSASSVGWRAAVAPDQHHHGSAQCHQGDPDCGVAGDVGSRSRHLRPLCQGKSRSRRAMDKGRPLSDRGTPTRRRSSRRCRGRGTPNKRRPRPSRRGRGRGTPNRRRHSSWRPRGRGRPKMSRARARGRPKMGRPRGRGRPESGRPTGSRLPHPGRRRWGAVVVRNGGRRREHQKRQCEGKWGPEQLPHRDLPMPRTSPHLTISTRQDYSVSVPSVKDNWSRYLTSQPVLVRSDSAGASRGGPTTCAGGAWASRSGSTWTSSAAPAPRSWPPRVLLAAGHRRRTASQQGVAGSG